MRFLNHHHHQIKTILIENLLLKKKKIKTILLETVSLRYFFSKHVIMFILILDAYKKERNFRMEVIEIVFLPRKDKFL